MIGELQRLFFIVAENHIFYLITNEERRTQMPVQTMTH